MSLKQSFQHNETHESSTAVAISSCCDVTYTRLDRGGEAGGVRGAGKTATTRGASQPLLTRRETQEATSLFCDQMAVALNPMDGLVVE